MKYFKIYLENEAIRWLVNMFIGLNLLGIVFALIVIKPFIQNY